MFPYFKWSDFRSPLYCADQQINQLPQRLQLNQPAHRAPQNYSRAPTESATPPYCAASHARPKQPVRKKTNLTLPKLQHCWEEILAAKSFHIKYCPRFVLRIYLPWLGEMWKNVETFKGNKAICKFPTFLESWWIGHLQKTSVVSKLVVSSLWLMTSHKKESSF